jgi:hypothetical protein
LKRREIGKRKGKKNKTEKLRRPERPSFLLALSPRRRLGVTLKTLIVLAFCFAGCIGEANYPFIIVPSIVILS